MLFACNGQVFLGQGPINLFDISIIIDAITVCFHTLVRSIDGTRKRAISVITSTMKSKVRKHESRDDNSYKLYAKARNKVKWLVKKEKREREKEIAQTSKSNPKNFWKYVNSKRKTASGIAELHTKTDDSTFVAESDEDKAEVLSDFFSSVLTKEPGGELPNLRPREFKFKSSDEYFDK